MEMSSSNDRFQGTKSYEDGSIYQGQLVTDENKNTVATGEGVRIFSNKNCYRGSWVNNLMEGSGKYEWTSGNSYEGTWKKGKRDGRGVFVNGGLPYHQMYKEGRLIWQERKYPALLSKLTSYTSTVSGIDKFYRTACYVGKILLWWLNKKGKSDAVKRLASFIAPLAETRVILRFFGLFPIIPGLFYKDPDPFLNIIYYLETLSMIIYYPLDHLYWALSRKLIEGLDAGKVSMWSCRAWLVYIMLDMICDANSLLKLKFKRQVMYKDVTDDELDKIPETHLDDLNQQRQKLRYKFLQNLADVVLAANWSVDNCPLPDVGVGIAGTISSLVGFYLRWKNT